MHFHIGPSINNVGSNSVFIELPPSPYCLFSLNKDCFIKIRSKVSNVLLPCLLRFFMKQTLTLNPWQNKNEQNDCWGAPKMMVFSKICCFLCFCKKTPGQRQQFIFCFVRALELFKGQLISKCLFDVIVSTKKPTKIL